MDISTKLVQLREAEHLSQREIEVRSGLHRSYISAVEGRHTALTSCNLERWLNALGVGLYEFLYSPDGAAGLARHPEGRVLGWQEKRLLGIFERLRNRDRRLLLSVASDMARRQHMIS